MRLLSIITINYNDRVGLKRTIASVLSAKSDDIEYIVVDGGSSDGSRIEIERNLQYIDKALSEPDKGIADAFNKGVKLASGEFILFLNSGDVLVEGAVNKIREKIHEDNKQSLIYVGKVQLDYRHASVTVGRDISKRRQLFRNYLPHQAMVISVECFDAFGLYDETYLLGMDYEWSLRMLNEWPRFKFWNNTLVLMDPHGTSMANFVDTFFAYHRARMKHSVINPVLSLTISLLFIIKRSVGLKVRQLLNR